MDTPDEHREAGATRHLAARDCVSPRCDGHGGDGKAFGSAGEVLVVYSHLIR